MAAADATAEQIAVARRDIMAECYGTLGALMLTVERYAAALQWIEGRRPQRPDSRKRNSGACWRRLAARLANVEFSGGPLDSR